MWRRRPESHSERQLREALVDFLRRNWAGATLLGLMCAGAGIYAQVALPSHWAGLMQGVLIMLFVWMVHLTFILGTGQTFRLSGKWGEDNTRDVLAWAERRKIVYGRVDNLETESGDVDHLVVGPRGILVIDSKWHAHHLTADTVQRDLDRALASTRRAGSILRSLRHAPQLQTLVVIWGGQQGRVPNGDHQRDDVLFLRGRELKSWLKTWHHEAGAEAQYNSGDARAILQDLQQFRRRVRPS